MFTVHSLQVFNVLCRRPAVYTPVSHEPTLSADFVVVGSCRGSNRREKQTMSQTKKSTGALLACDCREQRDSDVVDGSHMAHHIWMGDIGHKQTHETTNMLN